MALKQLMLCREAEKLKAEQAEISAKVKETNERRDAWKVREAAATAALEEITEASTDEERKAFEEEAAAIEAEDVAIHADEETAQTRSAEIEARLSAISAELEEINKRGATPQKSAPAPRKEGGTFNMRISENRAREIREAVKNDEVRGFLDGFRENQKRGVTNAQYTIPTLMLPMVREATAEYSKLLRHVSHDVISGDGIVNMLGAVPEAVWTDSVGKINEATFVMNQLQTKGSKLGAYVAVPNAYLEDSDENLAAIVVDYLGRSMGYTLDKTIMFGTGENNIPVGIVTRLAAAMQPAWWQAKLPAFTDLSTTHVGHAGTAGSSGAKFFEAMVGVLGTAREKYTGAMGSKFWAMNEKTWNAIVGKLISINAAGAIVTGANRTMPVIGGDVEILEFMPDELVAGGYGNQYKLVERKGIAIRRSEETMFLEDQTVYKATSRWDGFPYAGEGFAAFGIGSGEPTLTVSFAADAANAG